MSETEFEDLWVGAIGEIKGREEVEAVEEKLIVQPTEPKTHEEPSVFQVPAPQKSPFPVQSDDHSGSRWQDINSKLLL